MKVATVQFASKIGDLRYNIDCADSLLRAADLQHVQLLVLPELALTGYNFPTLHAISNYLEPTCAGPTAWWAAKQAKARGCIVSIGYPEITIDPDSVLSQVPFDSSATLENAIEKAHAYVESIKTTVNPKVDFWTFNSTLTIAPDGTVVAHYRKTHLYYTDVTWASPSSQGFSSSILRFPDSQVKASFAICMDLNPKSFTANWQDYEVARNVIAHNSSLLVISTAWMTRDDALESDDGLECCPGNVAAEPDMETLLYWIERLLPLMERKQDTVVIIANRIGVEKGLVRACDLENLTRPSFQVEQAANRKETESHVSKSAGLSSFSSGHDVLDMDEEIMDREVNQSGMVSSSAHYAGTSSMIRMGHGKVSVLGVLGRGEQQVLISDTDDEPVMTFKRRDKGEEEEEVSEEEEEEEGEGKEEEEVDEAEGNARHSPSP